MKSGTEKRICKSKCTKHIRFGAILDVPKSKNGTPLWREAHLQVKMHKTPQVRSNFWSSKLEKWHVPVARSSLASQNARKLRGSEQFWKLRCPRMACRCGAKHICKSKCTKHVRFGAIFEVPKSKNGTPLWREAHLQVEMLENWGVRSNFGSYDFQKNGTRLWREAHLQVKVYKTPFRRRKIAHRCGEKHIFKSKCTKQRMFGPFRTTFSSSDVEKIVS